MKGYLLLKDVMIIYARILSAAVWGQRVPSWAQVRAPLGGTGSWSSWKGCCPYQQALACLLQIDEAPAAWFQAAAGTGSALAISGRRQKGIWTLLLGVVCSLGSHLGPPLTRVAVQL